MTVKTPPELPIPEPADDGAMPQHLAALRADFDARAGRSLSLPLAGLAVWTAVGVAGLALSSTEATYVLVFATGVIFPLALLLARLLGESLLGNTSPLAMLMAMSVVMVNLLWAVHLTLLATRPEYLPLTLAIGLGLHWVVFSWIIRHPVGVFHALARTILATGLWWLVPSHRVTAVAAGVVVAYAYAVATLARRNPWGAPTADHPTPPAATSGGPSGMATADRRSPR